MRMEIIITGIVPWNSYWAWNNYYNPYCGGIPYYPGSVIIKNPRNYTPPSRALVFNPSSYNPGNSSTGNRSLSNSYNSNNGSRYNNSNRSSNNNSLGGAVRKVFSNDNSGNSNYNSITTQLLHEAIRLLLPVPVHHHLQEAVAAKAGRCFEATQITGV